MNYILSRKAEEDIISIYLHGLENFGDIQADAYHTKLQACFEFLAQNPLSANERLELSPPVRIHPVGVHIVIYQLIDAHNIFIIRVRHEREDWL
ncbi:type II toxin-antitoxin system RelE/ParE family toxin [Marinobacter sp.]|uniref:type II toxin-antitoxin system RelE/ParE family toxin n=1 Tax=Marinobacter sp. TaxID=50741 RepID=UPI000C3FB981|nr:type II toxin-antitoxin system RelE/ParE family toxin [Marinobacter sp.]MAO14534.1 plasmid stabilization protein ParE [Marinobacter sp.]|tara:strand:+ start:281 stop:562 length:282 start_codon:yes stop_codon:yes gene_type:complete